MAKAKTIPTALGPIDVYSEVGKSGLKRWGGNINEEFLPELRGMKGHKVIQEMTYNDPIIGACLGVIKRYMRACPMRVEAAGDDNRSTQAADLLKTAQDDMEATWSDTLSDWLTFLDHGYAPAEVVYKQRGGESNDPTKNSKYSDGMIGWRRIPLRKQQSVLNWIYDDKTDALLGLRQSVLSGNSGLTQIPLEKLLLFRTEPAGGNPEGRSILRTAYKSWYFAKQIQQIEGIGIERDLVGLGVCRIPASVIAARGTEYEEWKSVTTNVRRDEQEGLVLPSDRDSNGQFLYDFALLTSGGKRNFDTGAVIQRYQRDMATALFADFILLGHEKVGSYSLADVKVKGVFSIAVEGWIDSMLDVFNRFAIPRLMKLNGFAAAEYPRLARGQVGQTNLAEISAYVTALSQAGFTIDLVPGLQDHLLTLAELPTEQSEQVGKRARKMARAIAQEAKAA